MGSLGDGEQLRVAQYRQSADTQDVDSDAMKHLVMGMIAVALVFATLIGTLVLSDVLHALSGIICSAVDLPSPHPGS